MAEIHKVPNYAKPPRRFLGFIICRHVWKDYWKQHPHDASVSVCIKKCARCLKEQKVRWS